MHVWQPNIVPMSWTCKKRAAASHSCIEEEITSSDAGLELEGIPALNLWDLVINVSEPPARRDPMRNTNPKNEITHGEQEVNTQC